jgi:hypothetical protein
MRYILHIQSAQRKAVGAPVPIHGLGLTHRSSGPSEIIRGVYQTAAPEIVPITERAAAIAEIKERTASARARFHVSKLIGLERPPAPDYEWAQPPVRLGWEEWDIDFGETPKPKREPRKPVGFSIETGPAFFPTGKMRQDKNSESTPEMKPAGSKAVVTIGERVFSVISRSQRVTSRFGDSQTSVTLSSAIQSIARMAGEDAAREAKAAFLATAPGLE